MNDALDTNLQLWNAWTPLHEASDFYDLPGFKAGKSSLRPVERAELTDVVGRSLLHLQCHFGLDTLSWARKGAFVTGVDFSDRSIALAQSLSAELDIPAAFVCSDIEHLPEVLSGQFEIVFSSYGVLPWLRNLQRWAEVIAHFLAPSGIFYLVDDHPLMRTLRMNDAGELTIANPYFFSEQPSRIEARGPMPRRVMSRHRCVSGISGITAWGRFWERCLVWACGSSSCTSFLLRCGTSFPIWSVATMACGGFVVHPSFRCSSPCRRVSRRVSMID